MLFTIFQDGDSEKNCSVRSGSIQRTCKSKNKARRSFGSLPSDERITRSSITRDVRFAKCLNRPLSLCTRHFFTLVESASFSFKPHLTLIDLSSPFSFRSRSGITDHRFSHRERKREPPPKEEEEDRKRKRILDIPQGTEQ